ncbi:MAG TPA: class I SAM-dependent methyltransferase [Gaiellaceae bacterium]|nr:class I SAM-dependent methyltransferase [Gaiellaceae bacterium]
MNSPEPDAAVAAWTRKNAEYTDRSAAAAWAAEEITWGMAGVPERDLGVLGEVAGLDVVELGCGTAYFGAWLAKRGARVVGVDPTPAQLATARRLVAETGIALELVEARGEDVPLPDASFDLVVSEYGASTWADPLRWVPEAARLLRPGGRLVFLHGTPLSTICYPLVGSITRELQRPYFGLGRIDWGDGEGFEYQLGHGEWIDLLRGAGLEVERLVELRFAADRKTHEYYADMTAEWARQWPAEEIWVARRAS